MPLLTIVEGWTGVLGPFTLKVDDVPLNLTGMTVTLILRRASGALVTPGGTIAVLNQSVYPGQVTYAPVETDFTFETVGYAIVQTYRMHWKVVDSAQKIVFFPNGEGDEVDVHRK